MHRRNRYTKHHYRYTKHHYPTLDDVKVSGTGHSTKLDHVVGSAQEFFGVPPEIFRLSGKPLTQEKMPKPERTADPTVEAKVLPIKFESTYTVRDKIEVGALWAFTAACCVTIGVSAVMAVREKVREQREATYPPASITQYQPSRPSSGIINGKQVTCTTANGKAYVCY